MRVGAEVRVFRGPEAGRRGFVRRTASNGACILRDAQGRTIPGIFTEKDLTVLNERPATPPQGPEPPMAA